MSVNIIELLKGGIGNSLVTHSADFLEENETETNDAVDGTFAALLASVIEKSESDDGAAQILKVVKNSDDHILENVEGLFTRSPQTVNGLVTIGNRDLPAFIDGKQREASNQVAADSGIKKNASAKLMRFSTPFLMSMISRHAGEKLDIGGLRSFLGSQKGFVKSNLSSDMIDTLELSSFGWTKKDVESKKDREEREKRERAEIKRQNRAKKEAEMAERKEAAAAATTSQAEVASTASTGSGFKWWWLLLPLLLLALLGLGFGKSGCSGANSGVSGVSKTTAVATHNATSVATKVAETTTTAVETVKETTSNIFGNVNEAARTALDKITFAAGSAGNQMMDYISGGTGEGRFRFKNLTFASGSAAIAGESGAEADNIAAILKAYPDVKIMVEGYTDNRGNADSNKKLSRQRADAVKVRLTQQGINENRIQVTGFGDANPVADNETAEGRAQNRRIEVLVQK